jgi:hypothetical protein
MKRSMEDSILRTCRPRTIEIGLYRQYRDPQRTKKSYLRAKRERDVVCFPNMLREYSRNVFVWRSLRRLFQTALYQALHEDDETHYMTSVVLSYIPFRIKPRYATHIRSPLSYSTLSLPIRFQQMSGRLVELGYPPLLIPDYRIEDTELKVYQRLWGFERYSPFPIEMLSLYHHLQKKGIVDIWRVMLSHIKHIHYFDRSGWNLYCHSIHADYFLAECLRINPQADEALLTHWTTLLRYPSCYEPID